MPEDYRSVQTGTVKRIFIALEIVPMISMLNLISSLKSAFSKENIKWVRPDNLHLTLVFLGNTEPGKIEDISQMLCDRCKGFKSFNLMIKGISFFRNSREPKVLFADIDLVEELFMLNKRIVDGLSELGLPLEPKYFNPHVTLGRIKRISDKSIISTVLNDYQAIEIQSLIISEVILYESILLGDGPVYKPIIRCKLG